MENESTKQLKEKLSRLTLTMEIPQFRRTSVGWLNKNMKVRNAEHKNFNEAQTIIKELIRRGV